MAKQKKIGNAELIAAFDKGNTPFPEHFSQVIDESCKSDELLNTNDQLSPGLTLDSESRLAIQVEKNSGLVTLGNELKLNIKSDGGLELNDSGALEIQEGREVSLANFWLLSRAERKSISNLLDLNPMTEILLPSGVSFIAMDFSADGEYFSLLTRENSLYALNIYRQREGQWELCPLAGINNINRSINTHYKRSFSLSILSDNCFYCSGDSYLSDSIESDEFYNGTKTNDSTINWSKGSVNIPDNSWCRSMSGNGKFIFSWQFTEVHLDEFKLFYRNTIEEEWQNVSLDKGTFASLAKTGNETLVMNYSGDLIAYLTSEAIYIYRINISGGQLLATLTGEYKDPDALYSSLDFDDDDNLLLFAPLVGIYLFLKSGDSWGEGRLIKDITLSENVVIAGTCISSKLKKYAYLTSEGKAIVIGNYKV